MVKSSLWFIKFPHAFIHFSSCISCKWDLCQGPVNTISHSAVLLPTLSLNQLNERGLFEGIDFHLSKLVCLLCYMVKYEIQAQLTSLMSLFSPKPLLLIKAHV